MGSYPQIRRVPLTAHQEQALKGRLARLPFSRHPALQVDFTQEAYAHYTFGARAGKKVQFSNLCHEFAHAAQFDPDEFEARCAADGQFHLTIGQEPGEDEYYIEPVTAACTLRECEVFAIEYHLLEYTGRRLDFKRYANEVVRLCSLLPDWWTLGGQAGRQREIPLQLQRFLNNWTAARALSRVTTWLDRTQARLA